MNAGRTDGPCVMAPCPRKVIARGMCMRHYQQWRRNSKVGAADPERVTNPETAWRWKIKSVYGLEADQWYAMLETQGGGCATCGTKTPGGTGRFHTDHCHRTGKVRGILCVGCNTALGMVRDNPETLRALIEYLEKHNERLAY